MLNPVASGESSRSQGIGPMARFAARAVVGAALLAFALNRANPAQWQFPGGVRIVVGVAAATGMLVLALTLSALRWWLVVGPSEARFGFLLRLYFVGQFFSLFLPTSVGGDTVRIVALSRGTGETGRALSSVLIERLLGVAALIAYLAIGAGLTPSLLGTPARQLTWTLGWERILLLGMATAVACVLVGLYGRRWIKPRQLWRDVDAMWVRFRRSRLLSTTALVASLAVQATYILVWYVLALIVHLDIPIRALLVFVPFVSLVAMLPVSLSGLGLRESAWTLLLQPLGIPAANAVGFSLLFFVANLLTGALGWLVYTVRGAGMGRPVWPAA